jgi:putative ABC transport system substrate-binding protein
VQDNGKVLNWVQEEQIKTVVALGKQGLDSAANFPAEVNVVIGAVLTPPDSVQKAGGILLAPAPDRLFQWLTLLAPDVKKVTVVYNPELNGWLIEFAHAAARKHKLILNALPAQDLRTAAQLYRDLVETGLGANHAVWLPQDSYTVDQQTTLPMLLKASWDQEFVVFSSNPAHVKRGALFGLYPDNVAMGKRLGELAANVNGGLEVKNFPIEPLKDLLIAVNLRTADHLRLNLDKNLVESLDLTFPATR